MIYNEQNQPTTPYKKKQTRNSLSFIQTDNTSEQTCVHNDEFIIIEGESIQAECLIDSGSYFECFFGIKHKKGCNFHFSDNLKNEDSLIKTKLSKFLPLKKFNTKIRQNFVDHKCIKIDKKIRQCINCNTEICMNCLKQCVIHSDGCIPICILKNKRNVSEDFIRIIQKVFNLSGNLIEITYASLKDGQFTLQMPFHVLTLYDILVYAKENNLTLKKELVYKIILECSKGVLQLNQVNLIHNDIKPQNILLDTKEEKFLLCDFNVSQEPGEIKLDGSKHYMAKEILRDKCCFKSDVYSLGVLFQEMCDDQCMFIERMLSEKTKNSPKIEEVITFFTNKLND